jgi:hypothetical protein
MTADREWAPTKRSRPRCGARCRDGHRCQAPVVYERELLVMRRRCRLHGGLSTGPRTPEGLVRAHAAAKRGAAVRWTKWRNARDLLQIRDLLLELLRLRMRANLEPSP